MHRAYALIILICLNYVIAGFMMTEQALLGRSNLSSITIKCCCPTGNCTCKDHFSCSTMSITNDCLTDQLMNIFIPVETEKNGKKRVILFYEIALLHNPNIIKSNKILYTKHFKTQHVISKVFRPPELLAA